MIYLQQAMTNLLAARLRSCLAMISISVGAAAIVTLMSCGQSATEKALAQFKTLDTDLLSIQAYPSTNTHYHEKPIELDVWRQLPQLVPGIVNVAPYNMAYPSLSFQGHALKAAVIGSDESLAEVIHIQLQQGHFVSFIESLEHDCVIGADIAKKLQHMSIENPLGQQIRLGSSLYTIIGIAAPWKENHFFNEDINHAIIIPIRGMALIHKDPSIHHAIIKLSANNNLDDAIQSLRRILIQQSPESTLFIRSAQQIINSMKNQGKIFTLLLSVIGSISLIVGGMGIMNIMLIAVSERQQEIGIRKAIGARNHEILILFLIESILLSFSGGVLGIIVGLLCSYLIDYYNDWMLKIYMTPILTGFIVSTLTGIFFGLYPAKQAAKLEPIESLRSL